MNNSLKLVNEQVKSSDINDDSNFQFTLSTEEQEMIKTLIQTSDFDYSTTDFSDYLWKCYYHSFKLPERLQKRLFGLKMQINRNVLLIKGLPISNLLVNTPTCKGGLHSKEANAARKIMSIILSMVGTIYTFAGKQYQDYIDDVFPVEKDKYLQLGTNKEFLEWHVEDGFHEAKADWTSLLCLRGDVNAKTYLFHARDIMLDEKYMCELRKPNFTIDVDPTFVSDNQQEKRVAILSEHRDPEIIFDPAYMTSLTPQATEALEMLLEYINENKQTVILSPGDMLIFDNRRSVHARSEYDPRYDGTDRWLLRALILESKFKARECFLADDLLAS